MNTVKTYRDHNYAIGTDELPDGRIKAKAHGRKANQRTFPAGTTHEAAARQLARKLAGHRFAEVRLLTSVGTKRDYAVYVSREAAEPAAAPEVEAEPEALQLSTDDLVEAVTELTGRTIQMRLTRAPRPGHNGGTTVITGHVADGPTLTEPVTVVTKSIRLVPEPAGLLEALSEPSNAVQMARAISSLAEEVMDGQITRGDGYAWEAVLDYFRAGGREGGAFVTSLLVAMGAADAGNRAKLVRAFPAIGGPFMYAKTEPNGVDAIKAIVEVERRLGRQLGMLDLRKAQSILAQEIRAEGRA